MKTLLARWIASRLESRARAMRRSLRDYQRHESTRIAVLEQRSRGLRLYTAWAHAPKAIRIHEARESASLPTIVFRREVKAAA